MIPLKGLADSAPKVAQNSWGRLPHQPVGGASGNIAIDESCGGQASEWPQTWLLQVEQIPSLIQWRLAHTLALNRVPFFFAFLQCPFFLQCRGVGAPHVWLMWLDRWLLQLMLEWIKEMKIVIHVCTHEWRQQHIIYHWASWPALCYSKAHHCFFQAYGTQWVTDWQLILQSHVYVTQHSCNFVQSHWPTSLVSYRKSIYINVARYVYLVIVLFLLSVVAAFFSASAALSL